jgi:hypothetical protein
VLSWGRNAERDRNFARSCSDDDCSGCDENFRAGTAIQFGNDAIDEALTAVCAMPAWAEVAMHRRLFT